MYRKDRLFTCLDADMEWEFQLTYRNSFLLQRLVSVDSWPSLHGGSKNFKFIMGSVKFYIQFIFMSCNDDF